MKFCMIAASIVILILIDSLITSDDDDCGCVEGLETVQTDEAIVSDIRMTRSLKRGFWDRRFHIINYTFFFFTRPTTISHYKLHIVNSFNFAIIMKIMLYMHILVHSNVHLFYGKINFVDV